MSGHKPLRGRLDFDEVRDILQDFITAEPARDPEVVIRALEAQAEAEGMFADECARVGGPLDDPYTPSAWEPSARVYPSTPGRDGVPTIDDNLDEDPHAAPRSYPAWGPGDTFVVTGPVGEGDYNYAMNSRLRFSTTYAARKYAVARYGAVLEEYALPHRWSFRVPVPGGKCDPRG